MTFTAKDPKRFQSMPDNSGAGIMVATNTKPGEDLSFTISGTGQFQPEGQQAKPVAKPAEVTPWEAVKLPAVTIVPEAGSAHRSIPTIHCMTIAP